MATRSYPFERRDVVTARPFGGHRLTVVLDADGLDGAETQDLAREFNLSETAFVLRGGRAGVRARSFTPARELPMAGHPSVGTAFALDARGVLEL